SINTKHEIGTTIIYIDDSVFRTTRYQQYFKSPGKTYYESPINRPHIAKKLIFASNGAYYWTQNDGAMAPYLQPDEEVIKRKGEDYPHLFTLQERGVKVEYIKTTNNSHQLRYTSENGFAEDVFFDEKSGLIQRTFKEIQTSIGPAQVIQIFDDYRNVNGVMIPFRVESQYPPSEVDLNIINELSINEEVSDDIFEFPKAPSLSTEEINMLKGVYKNVNTTLEIVFEGEQLQVKLNNSQPLDLQVVTKEFFMFRVGENEKSHVENIRIIGSGKVRLQYKEKNELLTKYVK
ncbi:hypothetical protein, partial [Fulvivirga lutimaris]|uniref:hypothetical protein n=1 Tax=Fulvivirga lutimaris TaxID=1819566 RepID=UPI0016296AF8